MPSRTLPAALVVLLSLISAAGSSAADIDLQRLTPVAADATIPLSDFFRPARFYSPKLNPTGTQFAALVETGTDNTGLFVRDIDKKTNQFLRGVGDKDVYSFAWLDHENLLLSLSSGKHYAEGLYVTYARNLRASYPVERYNSTVLVAVPKKTPLRPLIWIQRNAYDDGADAGVVQIDAKINLNKSMYGGDGYGTRATIVRTYEAPATGIAIEYLENRDGDLAFAITARDGVFTLFRYVEGKPEKGPVDLDVVYPISHGDQPNELIVIGPRKEGVPRALYRLDAATGELGEVLCQDKAYDIDAVSVYRHPVTRTILGIRFSRSRSQSIWFAESYRIVQKLLEEAFPKKVVSILGSNDEEDRFFVVVYSDRQPATYYTLDMKAKQLGLVESTAPWIDPARMQPMSAMKWKTRDGFTLEAYVTLPAGASKEQPVPLVVLPHGGPWSRDTWGFDREVQFLASRGYAVLQPNYRGSPGYDWMFPAADQWAFRKMHDDVTDAVKTVLRTGLIDPKRMAIMGTSFGGYLAACGAVFEPDLYRCAVTIAGVFDWERVIAEAKYDQYENAKFGILRRNLGDRKTDHADFDAISPLRHVARAKVPFLVAHGTDDSVASITESRALISELERFRIPHESLLVRGEGHGMSKVENEVRLYARVEAFLAKHLAPTAAVGGDIPPIGSP